MAALLVDESCPRIIADSLRDAGHDVRYAADTHRRASDAELVELATTEGRLIVSEDFDFGELLVRRKLTAPGAIILYLPKSAPVERAARLAALIARSGMEMAGRLTIVSPRQVRQRLLTS